MEWHNISTEQNISVGEIEKKTFEKLNSNYFLFKRTNSVTFTHIFSSDFYPAFYYIYIEDWFLAEQFLKNYNLKSDVNDIFNYDVMTFKSRINKISK
jgi:Zn-dependent oligopeptidase